MNRINLAKANPGDAFTIGRFPHQLRFITSIEENKQGNYDLCVVYVLEGKNYLTRQTFAKNGNGLNKFVNMENFFYNGEEE